MPVGPRRRGGPGGTAAPEVAKRLVRMCLPWPSVSKTEFGYAKSQMTKVEMAAGCSDVRAEGECLGRYCPPTILSKPEIVQYCPRGFIILYWMADVFSSNSGCSSGVQ